MGTKDKVTLPKNWPATVRYLTTPIYSPSLTKDQRAALRSRASSDAPREGSSSDGQDPSRSAATALKPGPCPSVRITPISDPAHPAHGQYGLFATRDLRPGELVLPYLGEVHDGSVDNGGAAHAKSDYDLWLDRTAGVAVDAARAGNEARFVNDYRGVPGAAGGRPNAEFRDVWDARRGERVMAVFVLAAGKRAVGKARAVGIGKGQEILVSYGKGFWKERRGSVGEKEEEEEEEETTKASG